MIAGRARIDEAMAAEGKEMPFETLAVPPEGIPHLLLYWNGRDNVVGAVQNDGWAFKALDRLPRRNRAHLGRRLVAHGRIVADERAHSGRRRDELDREATAHAVAGDCDTPAVDIRPAH